MAQTRTKPRSLRSDIVFVFVLALAGYLAWLIRNELMLLYVSALFGVVLTPVVRATAAFRVGRWQPFKRMPILILLLAGAGALAALGFLVVPPVLGELQQLSKEIPDRTPALLDKVHRVPFVNHLNRAELSARLQDFASKAATFTLLSVEVWAGKLLDLIMGVILTVYFILDGDHAYRWFLSFFAPERRDRLDNTLQRAEIRMGKWLLGQGCLMLILGVTSTVVYLALRIRYAYALGLITGLLNIIPVFGAVTSVCVALLVAGLDSWGRVAGVAIFYAVYFQVENSYLIPRIMRSTVELPGLAILIGLVIGFALEGVLGAVVAVPTSVLAAVLLEEYLVYKEAA